MLTRASNQGTDLAVTFPAMWAAHLIAFDSSDVTTLHQIHAEWNHSLNKLEDPPDPTSRTDTQSGPIDNRPNPPSIQPNVTMTPTVPFPAYPDAANPDNPPNHEDPPPPPTRGN